MEYLKINNVDFSLYVNSLKVNTTANYNAQINAAGDTVVDFINSKRTIEVGFIPLNQSTMQRLQHLIANFKVVLTIRNPKANTNEAINCIIASNEADYYTIQNNRIMYKPFTLTFAEL